MAKTTCIRCGIEYTFEDDIYESDNDGLCEPCQLVVYNEEREKKAKEAGFANYEEYNKHSTLVWRNEKAVNAGYKNYNEWRGLGEGISSHKCDICDEITSDAMLYPEASELTLAELGGKSDRLLICVYCLDVEAP